MDSPSVRPFVHGANSGSYRKCKCDICRQALNDYQTKKRRERGVVSSAERYANLPIIHGRSAYANGRCKCDICREAQIAYIREHRRKNPDWWRNKDKQLRLKDLPAYKARKKAWRDRNIERVREQHRRSHARYSATAHGRAKIYECGATRRARQKNAPGTATADQIQARVAYYGGRCWICGAQANTIDHVIPLAAGGSNWPANLRPACAPCNKQRGARYRWSKAS